MAAAKRPAATTFLFIVALATAAVGVEFGYRALLVFRFGHGAFPASFVPAFYAVDDVRPPVAEDGLYFPNFDIPYRHFSASHALLFQSRIRTNNLGYRAERNWTRAKPAGEFRVAVLGDSITAALMSDYAWTDVAERILNADGALLAETGIARIAVLNFGVVGAGFDTMAQVEADHARRFAPDLTVVNFITPDILRNQLNLTPVGPAEPAPRIHRGIVDISTDKAEAAVVVECDTPAIGLGVPRCRPSSVIRADETRVLDAEAMREVKLLLSRRFIWGSLWRSTYPYALAAALGEPFQLRESSFFAILDLIIAKARAAETHDQAVRRSAATLARLKARAGDMLVVHTPTVTELQQKAARPGLAAMLREVGAPDIRFMGEGALANASAAEIGSWYNLPHDTHFSTRGVEVYGAAFAALIADELRARRKKR